MPQGYRLHVNRLIILVILCVISSRIQAKEAPPEAPGKLKEWSFSYNYIHLRTVSGSLYDIQSVGLNYYTRNSWKIPMITNTTFFVPIAIGNNGSFFTNLSDYYERRLGIDFMAGLEFSRNLGDLWRGRISPGWNLIAISMSGLSGYYPFQSLTTGPAVNIVFDRDWEQGLNFRIGLSASYQIFDLIHSADKLDNGFSVQIALGIGFRDGSAFGRIDYE